MTDEALELYQGDELIAKVKPSAALTLQRLMGASGNDEGAGPMGTLGDGVELGMNVISAINIRDDIDDSREAMHDLYNARADLYTFLDGAGSNVDGKLLKARLQAVDTAQDAVDRAQSRALSKGITVLWTNAFGDLSRILGRFQSAKGGLAGLLGFSGGDGGGFGGALLAGGIGAMFASMWTRRRRDERDYESNVPPV